MALVNGPLFSLDASGKLANAIVFTKWKGRNVVREYVTPANPNTLAQLYDRRALAALNQWWQIATTDDKESWAADAAAKQISPFNAYTGENLKRHSDGIAPQLRADGAGTPTDANADTINAVGGKGRVSVEITWDNGPTAGDLIVIAAWPYDPTSENSFKPVIWSKVAENDDGVAITIRGLQPGSYWIGANCYGQDGSNNSYLVTSGPVTIT